MDKDEALKFIGLKEPVSEEALRDKYAERFSYFRMLYTNAPNKIIERIQQQNLEKLNQVKKMLQEELAIKKSKFDKKHSDIRKQANFEEEKETKPVAGWLIVHTENKKTVTFDLYEGINFIGRKKKDDKANNIVIEDDPFVSRTHAFIKCKEAGGRLQSVLYDGDGSKPSVNGVFVNGNEARIHQQYALKENDTVQIGATKLVFKVKKDNRSLTGELEDVMHTDFIRTIDISK